MPPTNLATWLAMLDAAIFAVLGAIHVYWASGGAWGTAVSYPEEWRKPRPKKDGGLRIRVPTPFNTILVAIALFAAAGVMLGRVGALPGVAWQPAWTFPQWIFTLGTWVLAILFLLRSIGDFRVAGFFKRRMSSRFAYWDTRLFSPLCLGIALVAGVVALLAP